MKRRSGEGDEEQRKEDECDINWIFSFVVIVIFVMDIFAVTVTMTN